MLIMCVGGNVDFISAPQTVTIIAGTNSSTIRILVVNDNIVEGNETFNMSLTIPSSLGPGITAGTATSATVTIIDTSSELKTLLASCMCFHEHISGITVNFIQSQFNGSEAAGFVLVTVKLRGGISAFPFNVNVTALEQSPVSAEGNSVTLIIQC